MLLPFLTVLTFGDEGTDIRNSHNYQYDHDSLCGFDEKTIALLERDAQYRESYFRAKKLARTYATTMRKRKDHQFRHQKLMKSDKNNGTIDDTNRLRRLYPDYENGIADAPVIQIPVVFHVLYRSDEDHLSGAQLASQIRVLNDDFGGKNAQIDDVSDTWVDRIGDTKIEFSIDDIKWVDITEQQQDFCLDEANIKLDSSGGSSQVDPEKYLNIWTCDSIKDGQLGNHANRFLHCILAQTVLFVCLFRLFCFVCIFALFCFVRIFALFCFVLCCIEKRVCPDSSIGCS